MWKVCLGFLALYVTYVAVALIGRYINQKRRVSKMLTEQWNEEQQRNGNINDPTSDSDHNERTPLLSTPVPTQVS